jgi:hypothetical protein
MHECLLHRGSYIVSTHTSTIPTQESVTKPALYRYCLTLLLPAPSNLGGTTPAPTLEQISSVGVLDCVFINSLTYTGYGLSFDSDWRGPMPRVICRPATGVQSVDDKHTVLLPVQNPDCAYLSPDTGALTVCSANSIDGYYYKWSTNLTYKFRYKFIHFSTLHRGGCLENWEEAEVEDARSQTCGLFRAFWQVTTLYYLN